MRTNLHVGWPRAWAPEDPRQRLRRRVRLAAGGLALANAMVYALIGAGVARVVDDSVGAGVSLTTFGALAGGAFLLGAVLLWATDRRVLWLLGAAFQLFAIVAYLGVAPQRTPSYEAWGVSLKVAQAFLLVMMAFLALTRARETAAARTRVGADG